MATNDADRYLASHLEDLAAENEEEARWWRNLGDNILAEACMRVAEAARKARYAFL